MKKLFIILGGLAALAVIAFLVLASSLGSLVKAGVNRVGPQMTQSKVELADAKISPFSGAGVLSGLTVGNPVGWQTERAFFLKSIAIQVQPKSIKGDHVIVDSIIIEGPEITYETKIVDSNLQHLLKNIQQSAGPEKQPTDQGKAETPPVKIEIKQFRLNNARITIAGAGRQASMTIPAIALDNLGTKEGGLTPQELSVAIMKEISAQVIQAAGQMAAREGLFDKAGEKAGEALKKMLGGDKK